ncbi:hypothetical protein MTO96_008247 [Rhipicephalus appendiculatus]
MESAVVTAPKEDVLRRHLRDLKKYGNTWTGYADSREAYEELLKDLAAVNVCFQTEHYVKPKGAFIVQFETAHCIEEALNIFKAWNPTLSPKFWMVDYSQAEISALSDAFPNSRPVLCDFHREQAWHRCLSKKDNEVQDVDDVKKMLRQVAASMNEDDLTEAIETLKKSQQWKGNEKLQAYVSSKWLSVKEMWVNKYRFDLPFGTNNGTESKNKELKAYLAGNSGRRSLQGLLKVLVESFFPEKEVQFLQANLSFSPSYRLYHHDVPNFLHGRPPVVAKRIMERLTRASDYRSEDVEVGG